MNYYNCAEELRKIFNKNSFNLKLDEIFKKQDILLPLIPKLKRPPEFKIINLKKDPEQIFYSFSDSPLGEILIAADTANLLEISFVNTKKDKPVLIENLKKRFKKSAYMETKDGLKDIIDKVFNCKNHKITLGIKGSPFFIKALKAASQTKPFELLSYGELAKKAGSEKAYRAVGTAMGNNPVPFLIPCHRIIKAGGCLGGYSSGFERKIIILLNEKINYSS